MLDFVQQILWPFGSTTMNVLDRKTAADMLQVSIRTIDRYIRKGNLEKEVINGRIFIRSKGLKALLEQKKLQESYLADIYGRPREVAASTDDIAETEPIDATYSAPNRDYPLDEAEDAGVYKRLYEEMQEELKIKQERLEGANYRVGQLEGLLKESVPLLEYRKALALEQQKRDELEDILNTFEKDNERLNQTVEAKQGELQHVGEKLKTERFNKKVFVIMLIILFALQPLWLIFPLQ